MWGFGWLSDTAQTISDQFAEIYSYGLGGYVRTLQEDERSRQLAQDTVKITGDLLQMLFLERFTTMLAEYSETDVSPKTWMMSSAYWLSWITFGITQNRRYKAAARAVTASMGTTVFKPGAEKAAKIHNEDGEPRNTLSASCCKECGFTDKLESGAKSSLYLYLTSIGVEYIVPSVAWMMEVLLREGIKTIPGIGRIPGAANISLIARALYPAMLVVTSGEYVTDATLSATICGKHRQQYLRQYQEVCIANGITVEGATQILAYVVSAATRVPQSHFINELRLLLAIHMTGILHNSKMDDTVSESTRWSNPLTYHSVAAKQLADWALPKLVDKVQEMLKKPGDPLISIETLLTIKDYYLNPLTQVVLQSLLPKMLLRPRNFVNDKVVRHQYEPMYTGFLYYMNLAKSLRTLLVKGTIGGVITEVDAKILSLKRVLTYELGFGDKAAAKLVDFAKSDEFDQVDKWIRDMLGSELGLGPQVVEFNDKQWDLITRMGESKTKSTTGSSDNYANLRQQVDAAIRDYEPTLSTAWGLSALSKHGRRRLAIYKNLLALAGNNEKVPMLAQQLICYVMLMNPDGTNLNAELAKKTGINNASTKLGLRQHLLSKLSLDGGSLDSIAESINMFANSTPVEKKGQLLNICKDKFERQLKDLNAVTQDEHEEQLFRIS